MSYHEYTPKKEPCINCVKTEYIALPNGIFCPSSLLPSPLPSPPAFPCHFPHPWEIMKREMIGGERLRYSSYEKDARETRGYFCTQLN